ncbi:HAD family phosphatase [Cognatishimia sp. F0-27]|uniref:HAD family hydrolase n=1 Tax=Cognatishimia sp. F0-27 TaxID=2816855 RepID=UPI001D0C722C|nr:HAD family phosphatase [Cognatishimia sp. F0-27]MCC1492231.1 HAD family phosphatase [Cognatishimia sp. F0-27]
MTFAAILFDLDGTLIDTEALARAAGQYAFDQLGLSLEEDLWTMLVGRDQESGEAILKNHFGEIDLRRLETLWNAETRRLEAGGIALKPGARALLAGTDALGIPRGLATSSQRHSARRKMQRTDLGGFGAVVTANDVDNRKPAPDAYLLAARLLGVDPRDCLAFEDSETGAEAAFRAGMRVVQVPDLVPSTGRFAHHVAEDLLTGARAAGLATF